LSILLLLPVVPLRCSGVPGLLLAILVLVSLLLPSPLCLSKMPRWHSSLVGALHVFWTISKKLV
jgi:hypothetical protein